MYVSNIAKQATSNLFYQHVKGTFMQKKKKKKKKKRKKEKKEKQKTKNKLSNDRWFAVSWKFPIPAIYDFVFIHQWKLAIFLKSNGYFS